MAQPLIHVALADDHQVVTHALCTLLQSFPDIRVVGIAASGEELLDKLPQWPRLDVIVLDLLGRQSAVKTGRHYEEKGLEADPPDRRCAVAIRGGGQM
jgi:DNA-binding NarL/FixJ family response regulator